MGLICCLSASVCCCPCCCPCCCLCPCHTATFARPCLLPCVSCFFAFTAEGLYPGYPCSTAHGASGLALMVAPGALLCWQSHRSPLGAQHMRPSGVWGTAVWFVRARLVHSSSCSFALQGWCQCLQRQPNVHLGVLGLRINSCSSIYQQDGGLAWAASHL